MEIIGLDLWESDGMRFVSMVDQFSGFPMVQKLPSISSSAVMHAVAFYFNLFGNPRMIIHDQGKQLTSWDFKEFLKNRGMKTIHTSTYNPQANGLAESSVKAVKKLFLQYESDWSQCAPAFFNPNQKVHGLFHFYNADMHKTVQNQLKKPSVIGLPKFTIVNWLRNTINMQTLV